MSDWTKEIPTKEGLYWKREIEDNSVSLTELRIDPYDNKRQWYSMGWECPDSDPEYGKYEFKRVESPISGQVYSFHYGSFVSNPSIGKSHV